MKVSRLMSEDVITCDADASTQEGVDRMLEEEVGSVIVTDDGHPAGILTESDALYACYVSERPFTEIPIRKSATPGLTTINPGDTVRKAARRMRRRSVKKLPVVEDLDVVGIITMTDLVHHHQEFIDEALDTDTPRENWESDDW